MYTSNGCILFYNLSQSLVVVIGNFFTALVIYLCMFLVIISIIIIGPIFNSTEMISSMYVIYVQIWWLSILCYCADSLVDETKKKKSAGSHKYLTYLTNY